MLLRGITIVCSHLAQRIHQRPDRSSEDNDQPEHAPNQGKQPKGARVPLSDPEQGPDILV
jgi:hypothetical protein